MAVRNSEKEKVVRAEPLVNHLNCEQAVALYGRLRAGEEISFGKLTDLVLHFRDKQVQVHQAECNQIDQEKVRQIYYDAI